MDEFDRGHVGPPASRQIYLAKTDTAAWAIYEMTLGGDRCNPIFTRLSAGSPSLARLIPDALSIFETELPNRVALTITHTPVGDGRAQWLMDEAGACYGKPNTTVLLAMPMREGDGDLWAWATKHDIGGAYSSTPDMRFRIGTLRDQISKLFNPQQVVDRTILAGSPALREYETGANPYDIWLRPNWIGEIVLPDVFPPRRVPAPLVQSDRTKTLLQQHKENEARKADKARRAANDERIAKVSADWDVERGRIKAREDAEAKRKAAIEQRIRAEVDGD